MSDKSVVLFFNHSSETAPEDAELIAALSARGHTVAQRNGQFVHEADDKEPCDFIAGHINERIAAIYAGVAVIGDDGVAAPTQQEAPATQQSAPQASVSQFPGQTQQTDAPGAAWGGVKPATPATAPAWTPNTPNNPA